MKKLLTTLLLLISVFTAQAYYANSSLNVSSVDGAYFVISIDRPQFEAPTTNLIIDDLAPGNHYIKVARWSGNGYYGGYKTVFSGYVFIQEASSVNAIVTRNHFKVKSVTPLAPPCHNPVVYCPESQYQPMPPYAPVNNYDFDQMLSSVENRSFESTRMQLAKQFINSNYFTSRQVSRLLNSMTFESSKLELAKYAYAKTVDRQNYFLVNDVFTFESSITDLSRYISTAG